MVEVPFYFQYFGMKVVFDLVEGKAQAKARELLFIGIIYLQEMNLWECIMT